MQVIEISQTPTSESWCLPTLYKLRADGREQSWQIFLRKENLYTEYGETGGKIQTAKIDVTLNSSGRDFQKQALQEAKNRYLIKIREGYMTNDSDEELRLVKAIKSMKYDPRKILSYPVAWQYKLDGIRMVTRLSNNMHGEKKIEIFSYKNTLYTHFKHIEKDILDFMAYLPTKGETAVTHLDGEGFNKKLDFNEIASITRSVVNIHPDIKRIQYWIFDIVTRGDIPFEERYKILEDCYNEYKEKHPKTSLILVVAYLAESQEEIKIKMKRSVKKGYEGIIVRCMANGYDREGFKNGKLYKDGKKIYERSLYVFKRSFNIMKYKPVKSEEGTIIDVIECSGKEKDCGKLVVQDKRGNKINMRPSMTFEERRKILKHPETVIGLRVTFEFQELSDKGVPRFPVGKDIHYIDDEDDQDTSSESEKESDNDEDKQSDLEKKVKSKKKDKSKSNKDKKKHKDKSKSKKERDGPKFKCIRDYE